MITSEKEKRQDRLLNYLRKHKNRWTKEKEIAVTLYDFCKDNFWGSGVQKLITSDIQALNGCPNVKEIIIHAS